MAMNEDLVNLFSRNLSFNQYVAPLPEESSQTETPIIYSISQHYHHSAHIATQQPARPASEPPQTDQLTTEIILSRHGVDVDSLSPAQITLFKTADSSQQMRLIQLWQLYRTTPNTGSQAISQDLSNYQTTSFEQEEARAKLLYERQMLEERMSRTGGDQGMDDDTMSDESSVTPMPMTPIQGGDGRWGNIAEPYMSSGYEALARREYEQSAGPSKDIYSHFGTAVGGPTYNHATDPVYKSTEDVHKHPNVSSEWQQQAMENQYGAFAQFRHNHAGVGCNGDDEEML